MSESVGIIGIGPRGLRVLEELLARPREFSETVQLTVWDPSQVAGAGVNYADDYTPSCLINVPNRDLQVSGRAASSGEFNVPAFPSWDHWAEVNLNDKHPDHFPTRLQLGRYLSQRFESLLNAESRASKFAWLHLPSIVCEQGRGGSAAATCSGRGNQDDVCLIGMCCRSPIARSSRSPPPG